jgi:2Fe-2S ferredoxin
MTVRITFIEHNGTRHTVAAEPGSSLMQTALDHQVPGILADCGGCLTCGTCHGYLEADAVTPPKDEEVALLEGVLNTRPTSRLLCQIKVEPSIDGLEVHLPASQL